MKIAIVRTRWNDGVVSALVDGCVKALVESGVAKQDIQQLLVSGAYELPFAAKSAIGARVADCFPQAKLLLLAVNSKGRIDAVIAVGCLIKGDTPHLYALRFVLLTIALNTANTSAKA